MKTLFLTLLTLIVCKSFSQITKACNFIGTKTELGTLYTTYGDAGIDRVITQELDFLSISFLVHPTFRFYDDSDGMNAFSTSQELEQKSIDGTGTICFGKKLHAQQMNLSIGGTNIPIILAHEFAHTVARKFKLNLPTKQNELFADYLAGCYMYYRNRNFKKTDINAAFKTFYNLGDNDFSNPNHHGTPESREKCIRKGFSDCENGNQFGKVFSLQEAVEMGKIFVTSNDLP